MVELRVFKKQNIETEISFQKASTIANQLLKELNQPNTLEKIFEANKPSVSSGLIQNAFLHIATKLGFKNEAKGLFSDYKNNFLRPDYFLSIGEKSGILLEVERGKTTINNMDLLDFWKCHICPHADYLFLMVPKELRQNEKMSARKEFNTVSSRMESFFVPGNYTNVNAVFLFGY